MMWIACAPACVGGKTALYPGPQRTTIFARLVEARGFSREGGDVAIKPGSCYYIGFAMRNGATISGRVLLPDDKRDTPLWVKAVANDPDDAPDSNHEVASASIFLRGDGHYELKALYPGRYLIAAEFPNPTAPNKPRRIYYPVVTSVERAIVIEVGKTETRANIDFEIPRQ